MNNLVKRIIPSPQQVLIALVKLERRRKELIVPRRKSAEHALEEQVVQLQTPLEQLMIERPQRQEGSGIQGPHHSSVNLPKLEIPSFYGDKLRWSEFWDI